MEIAAARRPEESLRDRNISVHRTCIATSMDSIAMLGPCSPGKLLADEAAVLRSLSVVSPVDQPAEPHAVHVDTRSQPIRPATTIAVRP